jgi:hypothetical protein
LQIRSQTLQSEYDHIYSGDPAIDRKVKGWREKYDRALETSDLAGMPLIAGATPIVWRLRHLTPDEIAVVQDRGGANKAILAAARLGLKKVTGLVDDRGAPFVLERGPDRRLDGFEAVTQEQIGLLHQIDAEEHTKLSLLVELGIRVMSNFRPRKG